MSSMKYITQHPIKKSDLGFHGNLFGGKLLAWLDAAAAGLTLNLAAANALRAQWDLSAYDTLNTGQKCVIDTNNVRMLVDYVFYEDGTEQRVAAEMMSERGLLMPYTQFRTIKQRLILTKFGLIVIKTISMLYFLELKP